MMYTERAETPGDGTMVTYAQVRYTDLGVYVWVVCIYIYICKWSVVDVAGWK